MTPYHPGAIQAKRPPDVAALSGKGRGLALKRFFTNEGRHPFDEVAWDRRTVKVHSQGTVLEDTGLEFPDFWSQNSANITAAKYFRGKRGTPERETSVRQMVGRVAKTIRGWGEELGYFATNTDADIFEGELSHILVMQRAAFNSPVWFNVGIEARPQSSACFILKVEDTMTSILDWIRTEGMIFKGGSGAGINLSTLRSSREGLSKGGHASGPVSFMCGADAVAGMIASGGATRRAAKMVVLNVEHPDIVEFIRCKAEEERKVRALMAGGYDMTDINNEGWKSIQYQNANNSVRVPDSFMQAVEMDGRWQTRLVQTGEVADEYRARDLLTMVAQAAWECGDPGMQFDTTINDWHTCPNTGPITASNPCSEYMSLDNSACNLASINLIKFLNEDGTFAVEAFRHTVQVMILAQDIIVDGSSYPTPEITKNAKAFRQLGLGYANLGALLMTLGLPYDSGPACALAGAITSFMCAEAYRYSAEIAAAMGPYDGYRMNREPQLRVVEKHRDALAGVPVELINDEDLVVAAKQAWDEAVTLSREHGVRNSQVTVIAPTGTIALMMDCDTTGVEPAFALVTSKQLVGGGTMKFVNQSVPAALRRLGYGEGAIERIVAHIKETGAIEGAADLKAEHLAVFDCAVKPANGTRAISWQGHVRLVAAAQPFISGSLSKTFNMSAETTSDEIMEAYLMAWKMGLKCFAVYRDGSKAAQPLVTASGVKPATQLVLGVGPTRRKLPPTRKSETHRFVIAGHKGYLTYSMYEDGAPAEIFIQISKHGGALAGLLGSFAITVSMALQYGVPLKELARKFVYGRYEPSGVTENLDIRIATSITDYIFRYLALRFLAKEDQEELGMASKSNGNGSESEAYSAEPKAEAVGVPLGVRLAKVLPSAPSLVMPAGVTYADTLCRLCGGMMIQTGSCKTCLQCGEASGGCS